MHPQLWPALIGAILGFALIAWVSWYLAQRWDNLTIRKRWIIGVSVSVFELVYWVAIYATFIEPNQLNVRRVEIVSEHWTGAPLTIAALSDTHVGSPHVDAARVERIVGRINGLRPDLVALLGDYVGGHEPEAERTPLEQSEILGGVATFAALEAPLGVVAVLGNHDSWYNRQTITTALQDAGVAALWNRNVVIERDGGAIVIAGLADLWTGAPSYAETVDGAPEGADTIVLSHSPDVFANIPEGPALILAGHSHCGQVGIPLIGRPVVPIEHPEFACGRVDAAGKTMYVTGGIGTSILPLRFLDPPEIVLITIRSARAAA